MIDRIDMNASDRVIARSQASSALSAVVVALYREYETERETRTEADILKRWKDCMNFFIYVYVLVGSKRESTLQGSVL